jgi:hypothetical protein
MGAIVAAEIDAEDITDLMKGGGEEMERTGEDMERGGMEMKRGGEEMERGWKGMRGDNSNETT